MQRNSVNIFGFSLVLSSLLLSACNAQSKDSISQVKASDIKQGYQIGPIATFDEPWAMARLADGRLLITEKKGHLKLFNPLTKQKIDILGIPKVAYGWQGGLGDIALHPNFEKNKLVYLSYAEA